MPELAAGTSWGPFQIDSVLGRGPSGVVYRARRTADAKPVSLKIFNEDLDEPTLRRFEDDTRRLMGLGHPNILKVESVVREGGRLAVACELFEGRSLRMTGSRPLRDMAGLLLQSARALGAAWMRLILHRNLKPENILVSLAGEVKLTDFGQFRDATPYWSPERKAHQSADLRGDLFSLGTVFKDLLPAGDPDLDALLHQMSRVESFERVQMVEDVISRLEAWTSKLPASTPGPAPLVPPAPPPPPVFAPPPPPAPPPEFPDPSEEAVWEGSDPALTSARVSLVQTLNEVARRSALLPVPAPPPPNPPEPRWEIPAILTPPPPPPPLEPTWEQRPPATPAPTPPPPPPPIPRPVVVVSPPPPPPYRPPQKAPPRASRLRRFVNFVFWMGLAVGIVVYRLHLRGVKTRELDAVRELQEQGRTAEARKKLEESLRNEKASADQKDLLQKIKKDEWAQALDSIRRLDGEMKYADALRECEDYLKKAGDSPAAEAVELKKSLKTWTAALTQAEQLRKYGADKRAADLLVKSGEARAKDIQAILARWCEEDWTKTKAALDAAATQNDPYTAMAEIDRFLKKPHEGGSHKRDAETRKLILQADVDFAELTDRVDALKARAPADAAAALEAFLAKPHQGGIHRDDILKQLAQIKEDAKGMLYSGRVSISRLAASPAGKRIAFTSEGVRILDVASREELWNAPVRSLVKSLSFATEDRLVTALSTKVQVWDLANRKELRTYSPPNSYLVALAAKPDGKTVVGALADGSLFVWDSDSDGPPKLDKDAAPGALALALNADGSRLALACRDKTLRVRELSGGTEQKWTGPPVTVSALALSPDGKKVLAGSANGMVTVWTAETGEAGPGVNGHTGSVTCAAISPDGSLLATGGADSRIQLASMKDGSTVKVLTGHRGRISSVAFVPGGLVSSSSDGSVRIWTLK